MKYAHTFAALGLSLTLACTTEPSKSEEPAPAIHAQSSTGSTGANSQGSKPIDAGTPIQNKANTSSATGPLSEEQFKALHALRKDAVPAPHGTMITIGDDHAYLSLPANAKAPLPAIVVIHEWWGLNDNIKHWADRLAADGYAAVAVDLYGGVVATTPDDAMKAMKAVDPKRATAAMLAAHRFLTDDQRIQAKRRGSVGWCFGGGKSLQLALAAPDLDAAVMYYGQPLTDPSELAPLHAALLGIFGTRDQSIPQDKVDAFDAALKTAGKQHMILKYDAEHAFANPSNPNYDEKSAGDAWEHVRTFFAKYLKGVASDSTPK